jgi:hypothetical protein
MPDPGREAVDRDQDNRAIFRGNVFGPRRGEEGNEQGKASEDEGKDVSLEAKSGLKCGFAERAIPRE